MKTLAPPPPSIAAIGSSPFYSDLRDRVLAELVRDGEIGTRLPSERELARQFNVSNVTIARVMQELQRAGVVNRIPGKGTFLHQLPQTLDAERPSAPSLSRDAQNERTAAEGAFQPLLPQRSETTAVDASQANLAIVAAFGVHSKNEELNYWSHRATSHIERLVQKAGGRTTIGNFHSLPIQEIAAWLQKLLDNGVNGIVYLGGPTQKGSEVWLDHLLRLCENKPYRHLVVTVMDFGRTSLRHVDSVCYNGELGSYLATRHLLDLGHRRIGFLAPSETFDWVGERLSGFHRALRWFGAEEGGEARIVSADPLPADFDYDAMSDWDWRGQSAAANFLESGGFTAAVAANDQMACVLLDMARERGLRVPEDFSVVGFDNAPMSRENQLTTVHPPIEEMAERATHLTLQRLREPAAEEHVEIIIDPSLVVRSSTASPTNG